MKKPTIKIGDTIINLNHLTSCRLLSDEIMIGMAGERFPLFRIFNKAKLSDWMIEGICSPNIVSEKDFIMLTKILSKMATKKISLVEAK